jgi:dihydrolipoamide dehydrogenase
MSEDRVYDLFVIGAGPGGYVAALRAAQLGMAVGIVDKNRSLGGTCLNIGCIPSKALLESSELYHQSLHHLPEHGIQVGSVKFDLQRIMERKRQVVEKLTGGVTTLLKGNKVDIFTGSGRILPAGSPGPKELEGSRGPKGPTGPKEPTGSKGPKGPKDELLHQVEIVRRGTNKRSITSRRVLIATGSIPVELPFLPFDFKNVVSSTEALSLEQVPKNLVVIGAGAIGLEMGSVWSRLGSRVTVLELLPQIMPGWDGQISRRMNQILTKQGLSILVNTKVTGLEKKKNKLHVKAASSGSEEVYEADIVLVSVGRKPFHEGVGLDENGITWDRKTGFIEVDKDYKTSAKGVYAIGDVIRGPMLAHKAEEEGVVCVERIAGIPAVLNYDTVPNVIYTSPEVAGVGRTEEQLKERKRAYNRGVFNFKANGRALALGLTDGFVKILADRKTDRVEGIHIIGPRASELISEAVTVMEYGGSAEDIARTIHAHPTLHEAVKEAALAVDGRSIHAL